MKAVFFLLFFFPLIISAQVNDNFSDGDFTANPVWAGNDTSFEILSGQLHSIDSNANSQFYLSTPSTLAANTQWEFWMNLKFLTSSNNYVDVYLISDVADLKSVSINGYFVRVGNTTDEISLYVRSGATSTKIIDGADGILSSSNNIVKIKVSRNAANVWTLERDMTGTGSNYAAEGTVTDATFLSSNFFGVFVRQSTASFFGKHYFDDFSVGPIVLDTVPPALVSVAAISQNQLDIYFSETVDTASANNELNYSVSGGVGNPATAVRNSGNTSMVSLSFGSNFLSGTTYTLTVSGIQDLSLNTMAADSDTFYYFLAQPRDVVINEIMADINPVPNVLPPYEYVELYNRTSFPINLNGWDLSDAVSTVSLPNITILPDSFYIITSTTGALAFSSYGPVAGLSSFPSLNDSGDDIVLRDPGGNNMSSVSYDLNWYQDAVKENGGWSIEQIDPNSSCGETSNNWRASMDARGGTPGKRNSVNGTDTVSPALLSVAVITPDTIQLFFSEAMDTASLKALSVYSIDNGIGNPSSVKIISPNNSSVMLGLSSSLNLGVLYAVTVNNSAADCAGNPIGVPNTAQFAIAYPVSANDVVINEVLFDPNENGVEWVEIYNRSSKMIDLKELSICNISSTGSFSNIKQIAPNGFLILPGDYIVLSKDQNAIKSQYGTSNPDGFIDFSSFISLSNDSAFVVLIDSSQNIIDKLQYFSAWHLPLLSVTKGVSLERINYNNETQDESNWHSAAESAGFATPAYKNSQYTDGAGGDGVTLFPELFSPDNDGTNDVLGISYMFDAPGMIANVTIYDSRGRLIKTLVRNELLATSGTFFWDGITDEKLKARIGIYIVYFEAFSEKGTVKKYKKSCVVGGKL